MVFSTASLRAALPSRRSRRAPTAAPLRALPCYEGFRRADGLCGDAAPGAASS